jgi:hypothetical protein
VGGFYQNGLTTVLKVSYSTKNRIWTDGRDNQSNIMSTREPYLVKDLQNTQYWIVDRKPLYSKCLNRQETDNRIRIWSIKAILWARSTKYGWKPNDANCNTIRFESDCHWLYHGELTKSTVIRFIVQIQHWNWSIGTRNPQFPTKSVHLNDNLTIKSQN